MVNRVVGLIPARYGSQRLPKKMLAEVNGKTLIQLTYENAKRCSCLDDLVVATDHQEIYDTVLSFGGKAVMTSMDCATGSDRLAEAIENNTELAAFNYILNIQGDEPRIAPSTIEAVANALTGDKDAVVSTAVVKITSEKEAYNTSNVKCTFDLDGHALYFSRAYIPHGLMGTFDPLNSHCYKHLGIYGYTRDFLLKYPQLSPTPLQLAENLEQLRILEYGYKIKVAVVEDSALGIDTLQDLTTLRAL